MSSEAWQTFGNIVNTAGITGFAFTGAKVVMDKYRDYASPYTSLAESEKKLERVRSRLKGLSPQRREEIESQCRVSNCRSLEDLEEDFDLLMDTYYRLSKGCDEMTFMERHIPWSEFREHLWRLDKDSRRLFNDTLTTTVPCLDDMGFRLQTENPRLAVERSSTSESPKVSSTSCGDISLSRIA